MSVIFLKEAYKADGFTAFSALKFQKNYNFITIVSTINEFNFLYKKQKLQAKFKLLFLYVVNQTFPETVIFHR